GAVFERSDPSLPVRSAFPLPLVVPPRPPPLEPGAAVTDAGIAALEREVREVTNYLRSRSRVITAVRVARQDQLDALIREKMVGVRGGECAEGTERPTEVSCAGGHILVKYEELPPTDTTTKVLTGIEPRLLNEECRPGWDR